MSPTIRPMAVDDVPAVYHLGRACFDVVALPYSAWTVSEIAEHLEIEEGLSFVADDDGEIVGFGLAAASYEIRPGAGHLEWLAVAPSHRKQGVARMVVQAVVGELRCRGMTQLIADVASDNTDTETILRQAGFREAMSIRYLTLALAEGSDAGQHPDA